MTYGNVLSNNCYSVQSVLCMSAYVTEIIYNSGRFHRTARFILDQGSAPPSQERKAAVVLHTHVSPSAADSAASIIQHPQSQQSTIRYSLVNVEALTAPISRNALNRQPAVMRGFFSVSDSDRKKKTTTTKNIILRFPITLCFVHEIYQAQVKLNCNVPQEILMRIPYSSGSYGRTTGKHLQEIQFASMPYHRTFSSS